MRSSWWPPSGRSDSPRGQPWQRDSTRQGVEPGVIRPRADEPSALALCRVPEDGWTSSSTTPLRSRLRAPAVAILYGLYLTWWLLRLPPRHRRAGEEIARAIQEGAGAYLRKQYTTIAAVAVVPFLLIGFYNELGWDGYRLPDRRSLLGRSGLHRHERRGALERPHGGGCTRRRRLHSTSPSGRAR